MKRAKPGARPTRGQAIREFCIDCMGGQSIEVKGCTATDCALFRFRLGKEAADTNPRSKKRT